VTIKFNPVYGPFAKVIGMGPGRTVCEIADGRLRVRMGWAFELDTPLSQVDHAVPEPDAKWYWGFGAHLVGNGRWIINGSFDNLVEIFFKEDTKALTLGRNTTIRSLILSVVDPEEFLQQLDSGA